MNATTSISTTITPAWMATAKLVEQEQDSAKLAKLVEQLCRELDAARRTQWES
jgi:hypothetical protein